MKIYNYARGTGEFIGEAIAQKSPLEPGKFLIPAWSTTVKPPTAKSGKIAIFSGSKWSLVDDHRGKIVYSVATGEPLPISEIGPLPEGYTTKEFPGTDYVWSGNGWKVDEVARRERLEREARVKRDTLLKQTDWAMLQDVDPIHGAKYGEYRQQLRDITKQPGFPENVEWPEKP